MSHFEIIQVEDSFAALRDMPSEAVDHCITDPPYDAHCQDNQMSGTTLDKVALPFTPLGGYGFAVDLVRVAKRWALSFCAVEGFGEFRRAVGPCYLRGGIWYKPNSMGQLTGDRPAAAYEGLAIMHREGKKTWNGHGSYAIWKCNGTRGEKERHPNQKPLSLCIELVQLFTTPGDMILDPFCGSGRIGEAALICGRQYIGLERETAWVEKATQRCTEADRRFGELVGQPPGACRMKDPPPEGAY